MFVILHYSDSNSQSAHLMQSLLDDRNISQQTGPGQFYLSELGVD